jgi:hypothetical protein
MKKFLVLLLFYPCLAVQGQEITKNLETFRHIIASPRINVILAKGDIETIRLVYSGVEKEKINIRVEDKTLHLFLDDARYGERSHKTDWDYAESMYRDAEITAYVTFRELEKVEIRGNQELTCNDPIRTEAFVIRAYGENRITFAYLKTERLKIALYGENKLRIMDGKVAYQQCKLFGENEVDTRRMKSYTTIASSYGNSMLKLNTDDELRFNSFGDSELVNVGSASAVRGIMLGDTKFRHSDLN